MQQEWKIIEIHSLHSPHLIIFACHTWVEDVENVGLFDVPIEPFGVEDINAQNINTESYGGKSKVEEDGLEHFLDYEYK